MPDLQSRRRLATAAGISLLLHLAVIGALSLIGPDFAAEHTAGNQSDTDESRITIHALQDGPDARASARPALARTPSADAPSPDPTTTEPASSRPSPDAAPTSHPSTEHESPDPTVTEPASDRPSPDPTPNSDSSRVVAERTTSLPEGQGQPAPDPEARRTAQIASRETDSPIRTAERTAPPLPGNAAPRRSRPTGERHARRQTETSGVSRSELIRALYNELQEAFHYPAIARRRTLEGSVELLVEVAVDGELRGLTVEQSSGSHILDEAAAETVTRLFPRSSPQRSAHQVRLLVRYELD